MQRVLNFSGGLTSAYMTIMEYKPGDIVLFCDTGREHPMTYKFINEFELNEKIPVFKIRYTGSKLLQLEKKMNRRIKEAQKEVPQLDLVLADLVDQYKKEFDRIKLISPFDLMLEDRGNKTLPNRTRRFCTETLKVITARRFMVSLGHKHYENYIGFRADEPKRVLSHKEKLKCVKTVFPLYDKGITKDMVNAFWRKKNYTLEIPGILGNCTLCFMKGKDAVLSILISHPELAESWIADENKNKKKGHSYFPNVSIGVLRDVAVNNLFREHDLKEITSAYNCACTT